MRFHQSIDSYACLLNCALKTFHNNQKRIVTHCVALLRNSICILSHSKTKTNLQLIKEKSILISFIWRPIPCPLHCNWQLVYIYLYSLCSTHIHLLIFIYSFLFSTLMLIFFKVYTYFKWKCPCILLHVNLTTFYFNKFVEKYNTQT